MAILDDINRIQRVCLKVQAIARVNQISQVILDPALADIEGETTFTIPGSVKQQIKDRAVACFLEIKTLAAGLPSSLP